MSFQSEMLQTEQGWQIALSGRLDTTTCGELEQSLLEIFETPASAILIDFSALEYISSAGLRVFLVAAKRAKQSKGTLILCAMPAAIKNVFAISGFLKILDVIDDRELALAHLNRA